MKHETTTACWPELGISVDFPQEGEVISSRDYAFRISGQAHSVEAAIDDKEWQPCRHADGFWWLDWSGYEAGPHQLRVRAQSGDGKEFGFRACSFRVEPSRRLDGGQDLGEVNE